MATLIVGPGYLGQRVGRLLLRRGEPVFATCRRPSKADELAAQGFQPVVVDVLDPDSLKGRLPDVGRVVYSVGYDRSANVPIRTVYVDGLQNVLGHLGPGVERIVYASSTGVYGGDGGGWVDEDSPTDPRTESGRACLDAERVLSDRAEAAGFHALILRFAGLYGPGRIVGRAKLERGEPIAGDPSKFLNLVHIDDAASAVVTALDRADRGRTYLVADDRPVERREYYGLAARLLGAPEPRFERPAPGGPEATREAADKRISNRRIKAELGWSPTYPDIETGLPAALAGDG